MSLKGKYALITGSSRGIGRGIALKLAEHGVRVAINYCRNEVAANDVLGKVRRLGSDGSLFKAMSVRLKTSPRCSGGRDKNSGRWTFL
jgi:NAD(P)-dependent dehydrogenase (short-subunit alcohol dehydrogenase family)